MLPRTIQLDRSDGFVFPEAAAPGEWAVSGAFLFEGLDFETLPRFPGASDVHLLDGGEEYELLVTAPPSARLPERIGDVPLTAIGRAVERPGVRLRRGGSLADLPPGGFDHFRRDAE